MEQLDRRPRPVREVVTDYFKPLREHPVAVVGGSVVLGLTLAAYEWSMDRQSRLEGNGTPRDPAGQRVDRASDKEIPLPNVGSLPR
jgi:hypothetical protein